MYHSPNDAVLSVSLETRHLFEEKIYDHQFTYPSALVSCQKHITCILISIPALTFCFAKKVLKDCCCVCTCFCKPWWVWENPGVGKITRITFSCPNSPPFAYRSMKIQWVWVFLNFDTWIHQLERDWDKESSVTVTSLFYTTAFKSYLASSWMFNSFLRVLRRKQNAHCA